MKKLIFIVAIVAGGYWLLNKKEVSYLDTGVTLEKATIFLYGAPGCGYCKKARVLLDQSNVRWIEYNIENDKEARDRFWSLGGSGVPLIQAGNLVIKGYNEPMLKQVVTNPRYKL